MAQTVLLPRSAGPAASLPPRRGPLVALLAGVFMAGLDFFIVNVAIPSISSDLHTGSGALEWVIAGYGLPYGVGLITGARLGDRWGRRRVFLLAITLFTLASAACGLAPTAGVLIGARVAQGLSAALLTPQVLATVTTIYEGRMRARAIDAFAATLGAAAVLGQLIGGALIRADMFGLGWRACFLINVPIGVATLIVGTRVLPKNGRPGTQRLDLLGMAWIAASLLLTMLPLIEGREQGWPAWTWICLAIGVGQLAVFVPIERAVARRGGEPLVDMALFKERAFGAGVTVQLVFWMGQAAFFLVLALFSQRAQGLSALQAGLLFLPLGAGYLVTSLTARHMAARVGRQAIALGALAMVIAQTSFAALVGAHATTWLWAPLVLDGAGMGLAVGPLAATVLAKITPSRAGAASGVLATAQQIGNALGVAVIGVIFYAANPHTAAAYRASFGRSLLYLIAVSSVVTLLAQLLPARDQATSN